MGKLIEHRFQLMRLPTRIGALAVACLILSHCNSAISVSYIPPATTDSAHDYYQKMRSLSATEQHDELQNLQSALTQNNNPTNAIKMATLLSWRENTDVTELSAAVAMLQQTLTSQHSEQISTDYRVLAEQLLELLQQRLELHEITLSLHQTRSSLEQMQSAYGQLDERYLGLARVLASLEQQNSLLARQNVLMQQQIEALTVIEQQLAEREQLLPQP